MEEIAIKDTRLYQYRNFDNVKLGFDAKLNVVVGRNGMGKTNLLDSIHYVCIGKSYFSSGDRYIFKDSSPDFSLISKISVGQADSLVKVICKKTTKKSLSINDKVHDRLSDHLGNFPIVVVAPNDTLLLLNTSDERRKLIDRSISQCSPSYLKQIIEYNHLLKQRNSLLKSSKEKGFLNTIVLDSISERMYPLAMDIFERRKSFTAELSKNFEAHYQKFSSANESCSCSYLSQLEEYSLMELFRRDLEKDKVLGRTSSGIHKDDLNFIINDEKLKPFASQGQLKSFIMSLKLAQYECLKTNLGIQPILILDDVFDKLDKYRVEDLLEIVLGDHIGQVFISDTSEERIPGILKNKQQKARIIVVHEGLIQNSYDI